MPVVKGRNDDHCRCVWRRVGRKGNHTKPLHTYTIINAINDKNVLKFNVEYHTQTAMVDGKKVENTNYLDSKRIALNVKYLLDHFDMKTKRSVQWTATVLTNVEEVIKNYKKKGRSGRRKESEGNHHGIQLYTCLRQCANGYRIL